MYLLLHLIAYEIELYLRSKTFWLIAILIVIVLAFFPSLDFLLIQYMVISVLTRDKQSDFTGILASMPHQTVKLYLARALAVFLLLLGLWPFMLFTVGFLPGMEPAEWVLNPQLLAFLTLKYIVICMISIGFVFLIGLTTRSSWYLYPVITVCWAIGAFVAGNLSHFPSWTPFFFLGSGIERLMAPSTAVGYFPYQALMPWLAAAYILTAVVFLVAGIVYRAFKWKEPVLRLKWLLTLGLIWVMVCLFTGNTLYSDLKSREKGFRLGLQEVERAERDPIKTEMARVADPKLESYRLAVKLRTAAHFLEGTAIVKLNLADSPESIQFTLRNYFRVKTVRKAVRGEKLEWRHEGSLLTVFIPERYRRESTLTLEITYLGQVWEWFPLSSAYQNGPINFISPQFSLLRSGYAWYPVPGVHPLYRRKYYTTPWHHSPETTLLAEYVSHPPAVFELTVDLDNANMAVSNLEYMEMESLTGKYQRRYHFSSLNGRDVFLMVGPYHYEKRTFPKDRNGFAEVYCYHQHRKRITKVMESLTTAYLFYENLFQSNCSVDSCAGQSGKICTVVEIPPFAFLNNGEGSLTLTDTVLVTEELFETVTWHWAIFSKMQANKRDMAVLQRWWPEEITTHSNGWLQDGDITKGVLLYLYTMYMEKIRSGGFHERVKENLFSGQGATDVEYCLPSFTGGPIVRDIFMTLDMIRTSKFDDPAIRKIVNRLYQVYVYKGNVNLTEFTKAIEAVISSSDLQSERIYEIRQRLKSIAKHVDNPETQRLMHKLSMINYTFRPEDWLP